VARFNTVSPWVYIALNQLEADANGGQSQINQMTEWWTLTHQVDAAKRTYLLAEGPADAAESSTPTTDSRKHTGWLATCQAIIDELRRQSALGDERFHMHMRLAKDAQQRAAELDAQAAELRRQAAEAYAAAAAARSAATQEGEASEGEGSEGSSTASDGAADAAEERARQLELEAAALEAQAGAAREESIAEGDRASLANRWQDAAAQVAGYGEAMVTEVDGRYERSGLNAAARAAGGDSAEAKTYGD
jgi:hypothetical protein